jgi:hypothetical protein
MLVIFCRSGILFTASGGRPAQPKKSYEKLKQMERVLQRGRSRM